MNKKKYNKFGKSAKDPFNKGKNVNEIIKKIFECDNFNSFIKKYL